MDAPEPPQPFMKRLQTRLAASRFFTFSLLIHVVIVVMGGSVVLIKSAMEAPDFEASEGGLVSGDTTAAPPPDTTPNITETFTPDTPQVSAPTINAISTTNVTTPTFAMQQSAPVIKPVQADAMSTALGLLCFLGHGETTTSPEFGKTVEKAVDWIVKKGTEQQGHLSAGTTFNQPGVYEHAIAAYGLGEYYTMTKDDRAAPVLKQAIGYIVEGQGPDGGWMYAYDKSESDTSVSGWQIQALKAAHLSQLNIDGVDAALDKAMLNLKRVQGKNGGFGYRNAGSEKYSLTGVGVLCTYFWKQEKDAMVRDGIKYMLEKDKPEVNYKGDKADLYAWYYNTQACLMVGGSAWSKWNRMFQDQISDSQSPDGSWPPCLGGVGDLQKRPDGDGPYYRTTLCILMLEVCYRYMPVNKG